MELGEYIYNTEIPVLLGTFIIWHRQYYKCCTSPFQFKCNVWFLVLVCVFWRFRCFRVIWDNAKLKWQISIFLNFWEIRVRLTILSWGIQCPRNNLLSLVWFILCKISRHLVVVNLLGEREHLELILWNILPLNWYAGIKDWR